MKIALIHDWIVEIGGSERCLKEIFALYPSDVYTLFFKKESLKELGIPEDRVRASFLQRFPGIEKWYRNLLPLMPYAIEQFDLSSYDLIISSCHAVSKGIIRGPNQIHICYCHTPLRYAWDQYHHYVKRGIKGFFAKPILHYIRIWDSIAQKRVDHFIANSFFTAKRIKKFYGRDSTVIYPPVDVYEFEPQEKKEDFYLVASRLVPYKRVEIVVQAFRRMPKKRLIVIGRGPEEKAIRRIAKGNIQFLGSVPREILKEYLSKARAFIFAAEEDFGILPVEAQASGTPVIGYRRGGLSETVIDGKTGLFFDEQTPDAIIEAVSRFEKWAFDPIEIRKNAERFDRKRFIKEFKEYVDGLVGPFTL